MPSPQPGRPCQGGHPAPRGRAGRVTSQAGATRNHPNPEPLGRLSSHQACQAEDDLPALGATAGRRADGPGRPWELPRLGSNHTRLSPEASIRLQDHLGPPLQSPAPDAPGRGPPMLRDGGRGRAPSPHSPGGPGPGSASSTQARTCWEQPGGRAPAPTISRQSGPAWPRQHPAGPQAAVPAARAQAPG